MVSNQSLPPELFRRHYDIDEDLGVQRKFSKTTLELIHKKEHHVGNACDCKECAAEALSVCSNDGVAGEMDTRSKRFSRALYSWMLQRSIIRKSLNVLAKIYDSLPHKGWSARLELSFPVILSRVLVVICCLIVWQHYFYNKFEQQRVGTPDDAPNYWWKRLTPPFIFASKHAILLQLAIMPLTMCRSLLGWLAPKFPNFPFQHIMDLHIFIGYSFCTLTFLATFLFFVYYGKLCQEFRDGSETEDFCARLSSEIMATGIGICAVTAVVFVTSYFRQRLPFEVFYSCHMLVFVMYGLTIVHTLDNQFREETPTGKNRSQSFKWIVASLVLYIVDRIHRWVTVHKKVVVVSAEATARGKVVAIDVLRPWSFNYVCGQYAHLQIPEINHMWHPFSIESEPTDSQLTFLIEIQGNGSWTWQLEQLIEMDLLTHVNLAGPFGSPVLHTEMSNNVVAVGTGTGVVPMLSALHARARMLSIVDLHGLASIGEERIKQMLHAEQRKTTADPDGSFESSIRTFQNFLRHHEIEQYVSGVTEEMPVFLRGLAEGNAFFLNKALVLGGTLLWIVLEVVFAGLVLSWSNLQLPAGAEKSSAKAIILSVLAYVLLAVYVVRLGVNRRNDTATPLNGVRYAALVGMLVVLPLYTSTDEFNELTPWQQAALVSFSAARLFLGLYKPAGPANERLIPCDRFHMIWTSRHADAVLGYLPDINRTLENAELALYGYVRNVVGTAAFTYLQVSIYCTDRDAEHTQRLQHAIQGTRFETCIKFARPDFNDLLVDEVRRVSAFLNTSFDKGSSSSKIFVTFCGSPKVSPILYGAVERANVLSRKLLKGKLKLTYRSEFQGTTSQKNEKRKRAKQPKPSVVPIDNHVEISVV